MTASKLNTILHTPLGRRQLIKSTTGVLAALATSAPQLSLAQKPLLGFKPISAADKIDDVRVPVGYLAEVFYAWGDPVSNGPTFKFDASNSADEQALQAGMHHDAMQFFALPATDKPRALLVMNHEYIDAQILHADGGIFDAPQRYDLEKTRKEQHAHGVSVIEIEQNNGHWEIVRPSVYARRLTANTPMQVSGPAAGHSLLQTAADPEAEQILGTFNNCANGKTPWGTYLSCEENFNDYFSLATDGADEVSRKQKKRWQRYDLGQSYYGWHLNDQRFDLNKHPNEANRFGWIVEFDPLDPHSMPVKRTALGRFSHENVAHKVAEDGRVAFYSGDDAEFEYLYKFVTAEAWDGTEGSHHGALLDSGVLYVARFNEDGSGEWLPLIYGHGELTPANGFNDQADVVVHARLAADAVGATQLDRPEWVVTHPQTGEVYVSLTNNVARKQTDAVNPRAKNRFGHIIQFSEQDASATDFVWRIFELAGAKNSEATIHGDQYANPDGMMIDERGVLWVQTDISTSKLNQGDFKQFGNNQMLAVDPVSGESRRFLTGPNGCEITGAVMAPDMRTMWVNIQHPGEQQQLPGTTLTKSAQHPNASSNWPNQRADGRPRSATVMIRREDGGVIGG